MTRQPAIELRAETLNLPSIDVDPEAEPEQAEQEEILDYLDVE